MVYFPGPRRDAALRERLTGRERRRAGSLHRVLKRLDAASAERIHPNDVPKIVRALEVVLLTRRPLGESFARGRNALSGYRTLKIGLDPPRAELYRKLDARLDRMFESGLMAEVRGILDMGYPPEIKPFESHGYRQALAVLRGELTISEALGSAKLNTPPLRQAADDVVPSRSRSRMVRRLRIRPGPGRRRIRAGRRVFVRPLTEHFPCSRVFI